MDEVVGHKVLVLELGIVTEESTYKASSGDSYKSNVGASKAFVKLVKNSPNFEKSYDFSLCNDAGIEEFGVFMDDLTKGKVVTRTSTKVETKAETE